MRAANSIQSEPASPIIRKARALPSTLKTSTGLRPTRSDRRPRIGEKMSCASEKLPISQPIAAGLA